ncbi:hypothetical protein Bccel_2795 [Pseudobacteroides cellulosolvens ATCC 35603 = DSM 2933]|uniref:Uncharacterized protein n=1 Tax=Pseudobacteroides cellulosolvens ATCC 35603 = DSM 2933 TaxID=398512 RepID=A0A0L6JP12_9FIRM|nr:hypothetical protein Bccel_2795 [Pseudobacteroides cellulosolvens ATCC 35603 = DSM 2933]
MSYIILTGISIMVACLIESIDIKRPKHGRGARHLFQNWHVYFTGHTEYKLAILLNVICFLPIHLLCSFFAASNHFIITLEIIYLFSILIIILFKNIKIQNRRLINP